MGVSPHKSSTGLDANIWAMLVYCVTIILGWIPVVSWFAWVFPLIVCLTEKDSDFVRLHGWQALALYVVNAIAAVVVAIISGIITVTAAFSAMTLNPFALWGAAGGVIAVGAVGGVITAVLMILAILALIKAYQYREYRIPVVNTLAEKFSGMAKR